jgi:2-oxoisovalerate dehydrogenase E2 component (dihydrolipoyl transacylase)
VTGLVALREEAKQAFLEREGVPLTYLPFCIQAIVAALKEHPRLNAAYTDDGVDVHRRYHLSIAVATDSGLLTPVIRDADRKSITGLARELDDLAGRARDRTLAPEELQGATFTVNNTGAFGSVISQPIVPLGQVAIVTTEVIRRELRVLADGSFAPRSVMNLCISFDHRALDGSEVGAFMREVVTQLEAYQPGQPVH